MNEPKTESKTLGEVARHAFQSYGEGDGGDAGCWQAAAEAVRDEVMKDVDVVHGSISLHADNLKANVMPLFLRIQRSGENYALRFDVRDYGGGVRFGWFATWQLANGSWKSTTLQATPEAAVDEFELMYPSTLEQLRAEAEDLEQKARNLREQLAKTAPVESGKGEA